MPHACDTSLIRYDMIRITWNGVVIQLPKDAVQAILLVP